MLLYHTIVIGTLYQVSHFYGNTKLFFSRIFYNTTTLRYSGDLLIMFVLNSDYENNNEGKHIFDNNRDNKQFSDNDGEFVTFSSNSGMSNMCKILGFRRNRQKVSSCFKQTLSVV